MESPFTLAIIAVTALCTAITLHDPEKLKRWLFDVRAIIDLGQWDRLARSGLVHADWRHAGFNLLTIWFFAPGIEGMLGGWSMLFIYVMSVLGGGMLVLWRHRRHDYRALGASGGACGLVFAAIALFPGMNIYMMFIPIGIPGWLYAVGFIVVSTIGAERGIGNIGHDAHLGGAIWGLLIALALAPGACLREPWFFGGMLGLAIAGMWLLMVPPWGRSERRPARTSRQPSTRSRMEAELDALLDKVETRGLRELTPGERARLDQLSRELHGR